MSDVLIYACPSCGEPFIRATTEPLIWCAGVAASHAYHHETGVCVVRGRWVTTGEVPEDEGLRKALTNGAVTI